MTRRTLLIGASVAAVLILALIGWKYTHPTVDIPSKRGPQTVHGKNDLTARIFHSLCRRADSLGIDTTRFAGADTAKRSDRVNRLTYEMLYGRKPARLSFAGLPEAGDTLVRGAAGRVEKPQFVPYTQLVTYYNRLRATKAPADSLRLIRQTLNFYRYLNRFGLDKFAVVNIPAGELTVFDRRGKRLLPMQVIVGKKDKKTPCMATYVSDIVTYPYWNVPNDIAVTEMLPKIQRSRRYLDSQNLEVLDRREQTVDPETIDWNNLSATNFPYRIRQASGCSNALGLIKFNLANPFAIYLHDTNSRDLFTESTDRFRSHGCVRVQKPVELANLVLGATVFDQGYMDRCLIDQKPKTLKLPKPFPVFIVYNTADVDAAGQLRFYNDIYALDK